MLGPPTSLGPLACRCAPFRGWQPGHGCSWVGPFPRHWLRARGAADAMLVGGKTSGSNMTFGLLWDSIRMKLLAVVTWSGEEASGA